MRIGILLPSIFTSRRYGEGRIFAPGALAISLADGLAKNGHEVTLYTSGDVKSKARIVAGDSTLTDRDLTYFLFRNRDADEQRYTTAEIIKRDFEYDLTLRAYRDAQAGKLDIIHSFHDFGAHYFNELTGFPTVYTLHDPLPQTDDTVEFHRLNTFPHHAYVSISNSQRNGVVALRFVDTVYHGLDLSAYTFEAHPGEYLIHFGRIMEDKGTHIAIEAAKKAGIPLRIATSAIHSNRSQAYYDAQVAPVIDGTSVTMRGFLEGKEKSAYIGGGKAFLFPLQWEEPFGMVMIEAMACGTPVIAYNRGSVSEIVKDGVTGFVVEPDRSGLPAEAFAKAGPAARQPQNHPQGDPAFGAPRLASPAISASGVAGLVEAIRRIGEIDRAACRRHVEEKFSIQKMVAAYEKVYETVTHPNPLLG